MPESVPAAGHNSAKAQIKSIVDRVRKLREEKKAVGADIADIMTEAKQAGYDTGAIRKLLWRLEQDPQKLKEHDALVETYGAAYGE